MFKKHAIFILMIFAFLTVFSFAQEEPKFTQEQRNDGIIQMKAAAAKLKRDMTRAEVEEILGKATSKTKRGKDIYLFDGGEWVEVNYYTVVSGMNESSKVEFVNKYGMDLLQLRSGYLYASVFDFPLFIDSKEFLLSNKILHLNGNTSESYATDNIYLSAQDIENAFGAKINWDREKQQLLPVPEYASYVFVNYAMYASNIADFPVFIDDAELIMANPILVFNDTIYLHLEEISERFEIKIQHNRHNNQQPTNIFDEKYKAIATDANIFIDSKEFLTFNPTVTINNKIYLPADEVEEIFGMKVYYYAKYKLLEIKTGIKDGFQPAKNYESLKKFKKDIAKLRDGIEIDGGIEQVLGERYTSPSDFVRSSPSPARYSHNEWGTFAVQYGSLLNKDNIDLFALEFNGRTIPFPAFIDGKEIVISSPIVTLDYSSKVYIPIEDLAEYLNIKTEWNDEKKQLNITTK